MLCENFYDVKPPIRGIVTEVTQKLDVSRTENHTNDLWIPSVSRCWNARPTELKSLLFGQMKQY